MKRKRNIIRLMSAPLTALLLATSCTNSYPGLEYEPDNQPSNDEDLTIEETPIKIYTRNPAFFSLSTRGTRGTGPFDNETNIKKYDDAVFHVFSFRAGTGEDGTGGQGLLTMPVDLTMSAYSPTHETAPDRNNQSCLLDGQDGLLGMPFRFVRDASTITDNGGAQYGTLEPMVDYPIYYSGTYQDVGYNFFGYYIDDWKPTNANTHRTQDAITYDIDIDGSRDILLGYANQLKVSDFERDGIYYDLGLAKDDVDKIIGMAGGYSTFSGHRHVDPVVRMNHVLTRLVFQAYPGNASADRVRITKVEIKACSKAKLKVAGRKYDDCGISEFSDKKWMTLRDVVPENNNDGEQTDEENSVESKLQLNPNGFNEPYTLTYEEGATSQKLTTLGTSLLLTPDETYEVKLYYDFIPEGSETDPSKWQSLAAEYLLNAPKDDGVSVDANGKRMFMPGVMYKIKIGVFGLEKIVMDAAVNNWTNGGSIEIDPDNTGYPDNSGK